jgi:hypothetical protein
MAQFRKKPVVIEARQLTHADMWPVYEWIDAGSGVKEWNWDADGRYIDIRTLEGVIRASEGDWIIKGVAGEMYPCKPDIFAATYEPADATPAEGAQSQDAQDARRYRAFFGSSLPVCFRGDEFYSKAECDSAIDAAIERSDKGSDAGGKE